jgi:hypothetical protein
MQGTCVTSATEASPKTLTCNSCNSVTNLKIFQWEYWYQSTLYLKSVTNWYIWGLTVNNYSHLVLNRLPYLHTIVSSTTYNNWTAGMLLYNWLGFRRHGDN